MKTQLKYQILAASLCASSIGLGLSLTQVQAQESLPPVASDTLAQADPSAEAMEQPAAEATPEEVIPNDPVINTVTIENETEDLTTTELAEEEPRAYRMYAAPSVTLQPELTKDTGYRHHFAGKLASSTDFQASNPTANTQKQDLVGKEVRATRQVDTPEGTWAYVHVLGSGQEGWVPKEAIQVESLTQPVQTINYAGKLNHPGHTITSKPFGVDGFDILRQVGNLAGREVRVTQEVATQRAKWAYIHVVGSSLKGWIDQRAIDPEQVTQAEQAINYAGRFKGRYHTINTKPFGLRGFEIIRQVGDLNGREVRISKQQKTDRATWAYVHVVGSNLQGWVDQRAIDIEQVTSQSPARYQAQLKGSYHTISTKPFGVYDFKIIRQVGNLNGQRVEVIQEAVTPRATWAKVQVLGTGIQGWIDKRGLSVDRVLEERELHYSGQIKPGAWVTDRPEGLANYQVLADTNRLSGITVHIQREQRTPKGKFAYISIPSRQIQGWIPKSALDINKIKPQEFIQWLAPHAQGIAGANDLYASVMIAQAALETGWGNSDLSLKPNYNLFGIKSGSFPGPRVNMATLEDDGKGNYYRIQADFRRYNNYRESMEDYARVLTGVGSNWRRQLYWPARFSQAKTYKEATKALTGTYATDIHYGDKLNRIIQYYNLTRFDKKKR
ncbi:GW dipeptide domain-containing protein [Hutsoniella sourekii]|uniref:GW dipeptide domain-containing protein n=1 Tax=Hutsoniella sourekii TaxID=87650 RepID=UPI0004B16003|nr:GW dipeptide domain-containing protein [Hutsoniella sourekii]